MYWSRTENGIYTVHIGYELCKALQKGGRKKETEAETSVAGNSKTIWGGLWKLNIKHKLKHFLWKFLHHILSVKEVCFQRTGIEDPICAVEKILKQ